MSFLKKLNVESIKESLVDGVKAAQEGISNIDVDELVKNASDAATSGAKAIQDAVSSIDVEEAVKGAKDAASSGIDAVGKAVETDEFVVRKFSQALTKMHIKNSIRKSLGSDISAACGQLAINNGRKK